MKPKRRTGKALLLSAVACTAIATPAAHAESDADLAKQLVNPFTTLVRVPMELSYDKRIGPIDGGKSYTLNVQPLIPIPLNPDWTILSRTILTVAAQKDIFPGSGSQSGLGDTLQSFFLSPRKVTADGIAWGVGPAVLLPTATHELLGARKWGLGPTAGAFRDSGPWTVGILANHIWSVAGSGNSEGISATFLQPVVSYTSGAWSYTLQTEATYDWKGRQWSAPLEASVAKVTKIGGQEVSLEGGVHYWMDSPESGPKGWGVSFTVTILFPK
jgi:hypothetical protein